MPYIVRLKKPDGTKVTLPDVYPDPAPCGDSEIELAFGGGIVCAKVERCTEQYAKSGENPLETYDVVHATLIGWIERTSAPSQ